MGNVMNSNADLTPKIITKYLKDNPGTIQQSTYPNPGEPQLDEVVFHQESAWSYHCHGAYETGECLLETYCSTHKDGWWGFEPDDDFKYPMESPEFQIGEFLSCWVKDGKIVFESD